RDCQNARVHQRLERPLQVLLLAADAQEDVDPEAPAIKGDGSKRGERRAEDSTVRLESRGEAILHELGYAGHLLAQHALLHGVPRSAPPGDGALLAPHGERVQHEEGHAARAPYDSRFESRVERAYRLSEGGRLRCPERAEREVLDGGAGLAADPA